MTKKTLFIDDRIWERLALLAKRDGTGIAELVRRAIIEYLRKEEGK